MHFFLQCMLYLYEMRKCKYTENKFGVNFAIKFHNFTNKQQVTHLIKLKILK